mmetsp:Transcript_19021/g.19150  ORF Transcript_19021/g.19150 Transcript_19021/m.19150 type:complete len:295 (-) Transcript_19021:881-1765(-)
MAYRVFIGNLPMNIREREIDDLFGKYGRIRDIDLKTPSRPPAYAFITFDDVRDAEDAIRGRDGYDFDGDRLRVEFAKGSRDSARSRFDDRGRGRQMGRRSEYRVLISGLPRSASWQDLKDHMRKAGDVIYADVDHNGDGVVEFSNRDDMESAVRRLDDTEFKNPFDKSYIRVRVDRKGGRDSRSRSRDRSYSRSRSRDRPRRRRRSESRSRSRSPRSRSPRSPSRSRSRSPRSRSRSPSVERETEKSPVKDEDEDSKKGSDDEEDLKPERSVDGDGEGGDAEKEKEKSVHSDED